MGFRSKWQVARHCSNVVIRRLIRVLLASYQSAVKEKLGLTSKGDAGNDKRTALRAELDSLRGQQSNTKLNRSKVFDQLKAIQDGVQKKV